MATKKEYDKARQAKKQSQSSPLRGLQPQQVPGQPVNTQEPATRPQSLPSGGSGGDSKDDQ